VGLGLYAAADGLEEAEEDGAVDAVGQGARANACAAARETRRINSSRDEGNVSAAMVGV
jgi:hypothetical protein